MTLVIRQTGSLTRKPFPNPMCSLVRKSVVIERVSIELHSLTTSLFWFAISTNRTVAVDVEVEVVVLSVEFGSFVWFDFD